MSQIAPQGGFSSQGQLSWNELVQQPLSYTLAVLNRISNAGVDSYTVHVAHYVASRFKPNHDGLSRIHNAFSNLQCLRGFGDSLWFGIGVKSLVRAMAQTDQGAIIMAISSALSECYHEEIVAEILHEIVQKLNPPQELVPSTSEWLKLVKMCQGTMSATNFAKKAEALMSLDKSPSIYIQTRRGSPIRTALRGCSSSSDIADAILAIGKISRGETASIRLVGGADAGIVAALSEWIFGMSVAIFDHTNQNLYANCIDDNAAQVQIIFDRSPIPQKSRELMLVRESYYLNDVTELISASIYRKGDRSVRDYSLCMVGGRLEWQTCLSSAYDPEFKSLIAFPDDTATLIGATARLMMEKSSTVTSQGLSFQMHYEASSGLHFINHLLQYFQELSKLRTLMRDLIRLDRAEVTQKYLSAWNNLQKVCKCSECRNHKPPNSDACLIVTVQTILVIGMALTGMIFDVSLAPTRMGMEAFRIGCASRFQDDGHVGRDCQQWFLEHLRKNQGVRLAEDRGSNSTVLQAAVLFGGRVDRSIDYSKVGALSTNGICVYLDVLREPSIQSECLGRVHVVPGKIEHQGKEFFRVLDQENVAGSYREQPKMPQLIDLWANSMGEAKLHATQTVQALRMEFVFAPHSQSHEVTRVGPAEFNFQGFVRCGLLADNWSRSLSHPNFKVGGDIQDYGGKPLAVLNLSKLASAALLAAYASGAAKGSAKLILADRADLGQVLATVSDLKYELNESKFIVVIREALEGDTKFGREESESRSSKLEQF